MDLASCSFPFLPSFPMVISHRIVPTEDPMDLMFPLAFLNDCLLSVGAARCMVRALVLHVFQIALSQVLPFDAQDTETTLCNWMRRNSTIMNISKSSLYYSVKSCIVHLYVSHEADNRQQRAERSLDLFIPSLHHHIHHLI